MTETRGSWLCLAAACLGACGGPPAAVGPGSTSSKPLASEACDAQRIAAAQLALDAGRLFPARRVLEVCTADSGARRLLARVELELGNLEQAEKLIEKGSDEARALEAARAKDAARSAASAAALTAELDAIRELLARGRCADALAAAEASHAKSKPNAEASILKGLAESCVEQDAAARRSFARAVAELERTGESAAVSLLPRATAFLRFASSSSVELSSAEGTLGLSALGSSWVFTRAPASRATAAVPSSPGSVIRALDARSWLVVERDPDALEARYRTVDAESGSAGDWKRIPGVVQVHGLVASPFTRWFAFTTPDQREHESTVVIVDERGGVRRLPERTACSPVAVWSEHEYLSDCHLSGLFAVDVASSKARRLADIPSGFALGAARALGLESVLLTGRGGPFTLRALAKGSTARLEPIEALRGLDFGPQAPELSPDGQRLGAVAKDAAGRSVTLIWNLVEQRLERRWLAFPADSADPVPGRVGFSVARDRLALATCGEVQSYDWNAGAYTAREAPLDCQASIAATKDGFLLVDGAGRASLWRDGAAPEPKPELEFADRLAWLVSGGDWVAQSRQSPFDDSPLLDLRRGVELPLGAKVLALCPSGTHVAWLERKPPRAEVVVTELAANPSERFRATIDARDPQAFFTADCSSLVVRAPAPAQAPSYVEVSLKDQRSRALEPGAASTHPVALGADGSLALGPRGIFRRGSSEKQPLEAAPAWREPLDARWAGLGFAHGDRWIVARHLRSVLFWRARDGRYLGRLSVLPAGGALFTTARLAEEPELIAASAPVQLFGERAREALSCRVGPRYYPLEVCAERFEEDELLRRTLSSP